MAATLTGTPVAVTWASGANPAGQSVTIPSDATAVYAFWAYYTAATGNGLSTITLNSASPDQTFETPTAATDQVGTGVAVWYNPSTGSQTLDPAWDASPAEGATCIVVFTKGGDTAAWRDADAANETGTTACSVTLTTVSGDLVLKFDQRYDVGGSPPSLSSGWTNGQTHTNNNEAARLSYISASGSTQACNSENDYYSSVCAVSIPAASGATTRALTGSAATFAAGSAIPAASAPLTGSSITFATGSVGVAAAPQLSGSAATFSAGALGPALTASLTGVEATFAAGSVGVPATRALSGQSITSAAGTLGAVFAVPLSGSEATFAAGSASVTVAAPLTGSVATFAAGTLSAPGTVNRTLSGQSITMSAGTMAASVAATLTGAEVTFAAGSMAPVVAAPLAGSEMSALAGTVVATGGTPAVAASRMVAGRSRRRRYVVEVDGQVFEAPSAKAAVALLEEAAQEAASVAREQAAQVVAKRQAKARRRGTLNTNPIRLDVPVVEVRQPGRLSEELPKSVDKALQEVEDVYRRAERDAEIALLARLQMEEEEDEERAILFLL